jgi:hypothetical protein
VRPVRLFCESESCDFNCTTIPKRLELGDAFADVWPAWDDLGFWARHYLEEAVDGIEDMRLEIEQRKIPQPIGDNSQPFAAESCGYSMVQVNPHHLEHSKK